MMLRSLWIMRHGLAENEFDTDFNRALSEVGQLEAIDVAKQLVSETEVPELMLVSPFRRTQETARIVHRQLGMTIPYTTDEMLVHFADYRVLGDYLTSLDTSRIMVVSHMPIVAKLCQYLAPDCGIYGFQTAQVVKLTFEQLNTAKLEKQYLANC